MDKRITVSQIENFMSKMLTRFEVSSNISVGSVPATINKDWNDFAVIDVVSSRHLDSHAEASVNVFLYARPDGNKLTKDVKTLYQMEQKFMQAIEGARSIDTNFSATINYEDSDYNSTINFHFNIYNISLII